MTEYQVLDCVSDKYALLAASLLPGGPIKFARILNLSGRRFWAMVSISAQSGKKAECLSINCICMLIK